LFAKRNETERENNKAGKKPVFVNIDCADYCSLHKFWEIGQESNKIERKTRELALTALIEILQQNCQLYDSRPLVNQPNKLTFIQLALNNMAESNSVFTSIEFLRKILLTYKPDNQGQQVYRGPQQQSSDTIAREEIVSRLLKENIFQKVISNIALYQDFARQNSKDLKVQKEKLHLARLGGDEDDRTHQEYVDCFMNFLEFLIKNSRQGNLTFQHVSNLYENFVLCRVTEYEEQQFFLFIAKENENSATRERRFMLNDKIRIEVFKNIMCNG